MLDRSPRGRSLALGAAHARRTDHGSRIDEPWYEGEATWTIELEEDGDRTRFRQTVRYASKAVRDFVLRTPATDGVESTYDRLAEELQKLAG